MKPSVVVLGPQFVGLTENVAQGFRQNGHNASFFCYPEPTITPLERLACEYLPMLGVSAFRRRWQERVVREVRRACKGAQLLVVIKGDTLPMSLYADLLEQVQCPKVLWLMDSITRLQDGQQRATLADVVLYFEGTDRPVVERLSPHHHQIPLAAAPSIYYPIRGCEKIWDVSFVGALYTNRLDTLESILIDLPLQPQISGRFVGSHTPDASHTDSQTYSSISLGP